MEQQENLSEPKVLTRLDTLNKTTSLSKYLTLTLFILLPFLGGYIGYVYAPEKVVENEVVIYKENNKDIEIKTPSTEFNPYFPYQLLTSQFYTNKDLGFSIDFPASWTRYVIREDQTDFGKIITIGLPLQNKDSAMMLSYPESAKQVINIVSFKITEAFAWESEEGICSDVVGPCFENDVIASSTKYVYSTNYPRPHAGWDYITDFGDSEEYLKTVKDDFNLEMSLKVFEPMAL